MQTALATIFVFCLVVVVHEFGHFAVAKLSDVKVNEFSVGMGPRIFGKKFGETEYSLRLIPIGGFVKMEGEDEDSEDGRSFNKKSVKARMAIILAGAIMNFVLAFVVFGIYFYGVGSPTTEISEVSSGSPAYKAGLAPGDRITEIDGIVIDSWGDVSETIGKLGEKELNVAVERGDAVESFKMTPELNADENRLLIGISPEMESSIGDSLSMSGKTLVEVIGLMFDFIGRLFTGGVGTDDVSGPVGIIYIVGEAAKTGFLYVFYIAGLISVNLGFFNLLPIPALDGSRFMFLLLEALRGKPIDPEKEGRVHIVGFLLLMMFTVFITYKDIIKYNLF